jgi:uncharacterized protein with HEPN domain
MPPEDRDMARLWDMLDAARAVAQFTQGRRFEDLLSDRMLRAAVERNLEIAGEAARHVTLATREKNPDIPWTSIIGLRNIIAHEYGEIRYEKLWSICRNRLPELIRRLEELGVDSLPPEGAP